jgi:hypothetical protein
MYEELVAENLSLSVPEIPVSQYHTSSVREASDKVHPGRITVKMSNAYKSTIGVIVTIISDSEPAFA